MRKFYSFAVAMLFAAPVFSQCSNIFFSEYVEGSSNNKAIELYNPTASPVNLNGYKIEVYFNGATSPTNSLSLNGTIAPGDVYVIGNTQSASFITTVADTLNNGGTNFNGNDAVVLLSGTDTIDVIGIVGDTVNAWTVGSGSTTNHTLVRMDNVQGGTKNWALSATQWLVLGVDTVQLGAHTMQPCGPITDTMARFIPVASTVSESAGTYNLNVSLNAASLSTTRMVDVVLTGGTGSAADINGYTTQTLTFAPNVATQTLSITITDDTNNEGAETLVFTLRNATNGLLLAADSVFTLTIAASDMPVQNVTLSQVTPTDNNFRPVMEGAKVIATGTVYGINYRSTGVEFFIHDATDGLSVFSASNSFGYTVAEGDSVLVQGEVGFFAGVTQIGTLDTLYKIGTGAVPAPVVVTALNENTEAEIVRINNLTLVTPAQWTGSGSAFNVDVTDGTNQYRVRIDEQCALSTTSAPTSSFDIIGIGSQNDNSSPFDGGYQILPRFTTDLILHLGIGDVREGRLKVYPNPASGRFTLLTDDVMQNAELNIFDMAGRAVVTTVVNGNRADVDVSGLAAGIYTVNMLQNGVVYRTKLSVN